MEPESRQLDRLYEYMRVQASNLTLWKGSGRRRKPVARQPQATVMTRTLSWTYFRMHVCVKEPNMIQTLPGPFFFIDPHRLGMGRAKPTKLAHEGA